MEDKNNKIVFSQGELADEIVPLLNKYIKVVLTPSEIRKEYTKASLMYGNFDDASVDIKKSKTLRDKLLEGAWEIPLKNITQPCDDNNTERNEEIPHTTYHELIKKVLENYPDATEDEIFKIKRELLKMSLLSQGKISFSESSSESTIRIPKGELAAQELIAPIYGINRHRILGTEMVLLH